MIHTFSLGLSLFNSIPTTTFSTMIVRAWKIATPREKYYILHVSRDPHTYMPRLASYFWRKKPGPPCLPPALPTRWVRNLSRGVSQTSLTKEGPVILRMTFPVIFNMLEQCSVAYWRRKTNQDITPLYHPGSLIGVIFPSSSSYSTTTGDNVGPALLILSLPTGFAVAEVSPPRICSLVGMHGFR